MHVPKTLRSPSSSKQCNQVHSSSRGQACFVQQSTAEEVRPETLPTSFIRLVQNLHPLSSRIDRVLSLSSPDVAAAFEQKSFEDMGNCRVSFGKAHVGKSFLEMWINEKNWVNQVVHPNLKKEEYRKMIIYVEKMVQQHESQQGLPPLDTPEPQQGIVQPLQGISQSQGGSGIGP